MARRILRRVENQQRALPHGDLRGNAVLQHLIAYAQGKIAGKRVIREGIKKAAQGNAQGAIAIAEHADKRALGKRGQGERAVGEGIALVIESSQAQRRAHAAHTAHTLQVCQQMPDAPAAGTIEGEAAVAKLPAPCERKAGIGIVLLNGMPFHRNVRGERKIAQGIQIAQKQVRRYAQGEKRTQTAIRRDDEILRAG